MLFIRMTCGTILWWYSCSSFSSMNFTQITSINVSWNFLWKTLFWKQWCKWPLAMNTNTQICKYKKIDYKITLRKSCVSLWMHIWEMHSCAEHSNHTCFWNKIKLSQYPKLFEDSSYASHTSIMLLLHSFYLLPIFVSVGYI